MEVQPQPEKAHLNNPKIGLSHTPTIGLSHTPTIGVTQTPRGGVTHTDFEALKAPFFHLFPWLYF